MIAYIVELTVGLSLAFLIYQIFLKGGKNFIFSRFYLLITILLCLTTPLIEIETPINKPLITSFSPVESIVTPELGNENLFVNSTEEISKGFNFIPQLITIFYLLISTILFVRFIRNIVKIKNLLNRKGDKIKGVHFILLDNYTVPFSFFNYLFINKIQYEDGELSKSIINHEIAHCRQLHSIDIVFIEFLTCFLWFNPLIWLFKKAIAINHEFLADDYVLKMGSELEEYSNEIIHSFGSYHKLPLMSGFSFIQTKNRLIMLNKSKTKISLKALKFICVFILSGVLFTTISFTVIEDSNPLIVVVDAGHGGQDDGHIFHSKEKEINLSIVKKLLSLSENDKINIIPTRTDDKFLTQEERLKFANSQNADFFLSIHCNSHYNKNLNGIEVYYNDQDEFAKQSYQYSNTMISNTFGKIENKGIIKTAGFAVLKNINCPGILLNIGFLSNNNDFMMLTDSKNQDQIASSIYEGLLKIKSQIKKN